MIALTRVGLALASVLALTLVGCTGPVRDTSSSSPSHPPKSTVAAVAAQDVDVALRVLALDDGEPLTAAIIDRMQREGVPVTRVPLLDPGRSKLTEDSLASADDDGLHAHFAGIITPSMTPPNLSEEEIDALADYQKAFQVRAVETVPSTDEPPRYEGPIGANAPVVVTEEGRRGAFSYLRDIIELDPLEPQATTAVLNPVSLAGGPGIEYVPLVTTLIPGTDETAALIAERRVDGRESLMLSFHGDKGQSHTQLLSHGVVGWLTRGVSTSINRNYFAVHADDVLLPNAQWSAEGHCEIGRNCGADVAPIDPVRMVADDITALVDWQRANGTKVDLVINGAGPAQYADQHGGRDALMEALVANNDQLRLISHTFTHRYLGCKQDIEPDSWSCLTDDQGNPLWLERETVREELVKNQQFMSKNQLRNYDQREVVTGEHSGLRKEPQMHTDNPGLAPALADARISWLASDASEELYPRSVGPATTVPRYPIDLDYNTPTQAQVVSQYNWLLTTRANGGSGLCEVDAQTPCIEPLDPGTGFADYVTPTQGQLVFSHAVGNDPRPHFVHQSNLTGERLLYPVLDHFLQRYRATFADDTPLVNPTMTQAGTELVNQRIWTAVNAEVDVRVSGQVLTVHNATQNDVQVPITAPEGTQWVVDWFVDKPFGESYSGSRSAWIQVPAGALVVFQLPETSGFATQATWPIGG